MLCQPHVNKRRGRCEHTGCRSLVHPCSRTPTFVLHLPAGISDTLTGFKESISTFFEESELGATPPARTLCLTRMGTAWEFARSLVKEKEANRTRLRDDPHRIPEISIAEYTNYRKAFLNAHPEQFLTEHRDPNKRFVGKVQADIIRHGILQSPELIQVEMEPGEIIKRFATEAHPFSALPDLDNFRKRIVAYQGLPDETILRNRQRALEYWTARAQALRSKLFGVAGPRLPADGANSGVRLLAQT